jgi:hypothetical protein
MEIETTSKPLVALATEEPQNESIASVIGFSRLSVEPPPPSAVAVAEQELQAASPTAVATLAARCFRPALMIQILAHPVVPLRAPLPAEVGEIPASQGTLDRGQRTQTRTTSRPPISLSLSGCSFSSPPLSLELLSIASTKLILFPPAALGKSLLIPQ